ncbi:MAG: hypothetical protein EOP84_13270 [Verrucomicrobiaceae bacterium]|nr:MAG: hypothetical protein EOP84_13270 [Verrucomicrobiaceae bacterium]
MVHITTADEGLSFRLQNINHRTEKKVKSLDEVETWLREVCDDKNQGDIVLIYTDNRTSFKTVSDVLRRLKASGVKQYVVTAVESSDEHTHVTGHTDKVWISK